MMLAVLRNPVFARMFAAQAVALVGTGLLTVALGLLAYDLAGSAAGAVLGTALAVKMVAYVVVPPLVSSWAHRFPSRAVLVGSNVARAATALVLPFVGQVWQIYLLIFVLQAASATFTPTFQSVIPSVLVDEDDYTRGLTMSRLAYDLESLLSPVLAAVLLTVMSYHWLFVGTVAGFACSGILVLITGVPDAPGSGSGESFWRRATSGAKTMAARPVLRSLLALNMAVAAATGLVIVNTVVLVKDVLRAPQSGLAVMLALYGGGSMIAALALPKMVHRWADRLIMLSGGWAIPALLAATAALLAAHPSPAVGWPVLALAWLAMGAATSLINTSAARLIRVESTPESVPYVFAAQFSLSHACYFVTYLLAGWLGASAGLPAAAGALAAVALAAVVVAAHTWPRHVPVVARLRLPAQADMR